jgi:thiamine biosynthesis lipoprotein
MGTDAHVTVTGQDPALAERARGRIAGLEALWSRFVPGSDVSRLNAAGGRPVRVAEDTVMLIKRAMEGWRLSGGAFDPLVLPDVLAAGYDRSFEMLDPPELTTTVADIRLNLPSLRAPTVEPSISVRGETVRLRAGAGFDPGGIGKGLAADLVLEDLMSAGAEGACVNLGGDLRVGGTGPDGVGWTVSIDHPYSDSPLGMLGLADGAVATSTTLRRRWTADGQQRHHLIDPASGEPTDSDIEFVTVVAVKAWMAEVLAKAVLINGSGFGFDLLGGTGAEALTVCRNGSVEMSSGFDRYLGGAVSTHGYERKCLKERAQPEVPQPAIRHLV